MTRLWHRLLDALLGHHCRLGCGQRVYPADVGWHERDDHAGDRLPGHDRTRP